MEIKSIAPFLEYFQKIRGRTMRIIRCIPPDKIEWTYQAGKFTLGDLARHLVTIERYMYAESARFQPSQYPGCGRELADGYNAVIDFMESLHQESMDIFSQLSDADLQKKCETPAGVPITLWKWLRAMVEHEVHHRGQIYMYLRILGVETPPLYGLTAEAVQAKSKGGV